MENYASYLSSNYQNEIDNRDDLFLFWTSCKFKSRKTSFLSSNEPYCHHSKSLYNSYQYPLVDMNGLIANTINVTLNSFKGLKEVKLNFSYLSEFISELKNKITTNSSLGLEYFLKKNNKTISEIFQLSEYVFLGKKSSRTPSVVTQVIGNNLTKSSSDQCYSFSEKPNGIRYISLPFIEKCYHMTILNSTAQNKNYSMVGHRDDFSLYNISNEIITGILNSLGVISIDSCMNISTSNVILSNLNKKCHAITKLNNFNNNTYLSRLNHSGNFQVILQSFSDIKKTLNLGCKDTAIETNDLVQHCLTSDGTKTCHFSCPINCDLEQANNVWQIKPFQYLSHSSICQSAYHSNILTKNIDKKLLNGFLLWNDNKSTKNETISISNNGITSNIWPSNIRMSKIDKNRFSFNGSVRLKNISKRSIEEAILLVKALFQSSESKLIDVHIFHSTDQFNNFNFNLKKLIHNSEGPEVEYRITASSRNSATLTWITMYSPDINSFYDLRINYLNSIKFPINMYNDGDTLVTATKNMYRLQINEPSNINISKSHSKRFSCKWYYMNFKSKTKCVDNFKLSNQKNIGDPENQIIIIHPQIYMNKLRQFSRIHFIKDKNSQEKCKNKGIFDGNKCVCFPGFNGIFCEKICDNNHFGSSCEFSCPENNCQGYLLCNIDPIGCSCLPGFSGYDCNERCDSNHWGPNCQNSFTSLLITGGA